MIFVHIIRKLVKKNIAPPKKPVSFMRDEGNESLYILDKIFFR